MLCFHLNGLRIQLCQTSKAPSVVHQVSVILYEMGRTYWNARSRYSLLLMGTNGPILVLFLITHTPQRAMWYANIILSINIHLTEQLFFLF